MEKYTHKVHYYETDRMGITHHSNYIRWMEEARIDFLKQLGWDYARLEKEGIISPTVEVSCKYKRSTTFSDDVFIIVKIREFKGVKLILDYSMKNAEGAVVAECESVHCFISKEGKPIRLAKEFPEFNKAITDNIED